MGLRQRLGLSGDLWGFIAVRVKLLGTEHRLLQLKTSQVGWSGLCLVSAAGFMADWLGWD